MSELLFPESVVFSPDVEKRAFDRLRELSRLRSYFLVLWMLMTTASVVLRQYRSVTVVLAAGAGLACGALFLAERRPRLAALALGPLVETRRQRRRRHARSACLLASFGLLVFSGLTRIGDDVLLLGLAALGIASWAVLSVIGRRQR